MTRSREVSKGATRVEYVYTATAGQTSFSGNDGNSNSLSYTAGQIDVFLNGVRLAAADYTATNGTAVVLGVGAEAGDTLNINAFGTFSVADVIVDRLEFDYTATAGQTTFTGSDNDSQTMAYTAGRIDVYLNGSHLNQTDDYVATNGTSVVLEAGAQAGDSLVVVAHGTVNLASNILSGDLDLNGNELILDVDGDTTITADTDDQIDIKIAGTDTVVITAGAMALKGTTPTLTIGDAGAEDTKIVFDGNAQDYHIGLDDSSDSLTIGKGSTLGTTTSVVIDANGIITTPLQPAFSVVPASAQDNGTGDGTEITVVFGTEVFDKNADFASNAFTAPVTGSYFLTASVSIHDHTSSNTTGRMHISTSNRGYMYEFDPAENISGAGVGSFAISVLADMDAGDTASVLLNIFDAGSKAVDIQTNGTFFQGHLVG